MRTDFFLCISELKVASGPRVKLASCKSALNPSLAYSTDRSKAVVPVLVVLFVALWFILRGDLFYVLSALNPPVVCSADRSKAVVPVLVLLFVALWFILRGDLFYVLPCVILFLCFSVLSICF